MRDAVAHVSRLRRTGVGTILVRGSLDLVAALLEAGQVDELDLFVTSVVLGDGRRLVPASRRIELRQLQAQDWGGLTHLRYGVGPD